METKYSAKVGGIVLLALAVAFGLWTYLSRMTTDTYKIRVLFTDSQGLGASSVVRMQGFPIGEVTQVDLDGIRPYAVLAIKNKYKIPTKAHFSVTSGLLISQPALQVVVPKENVTAYLPTDGSAVVQGDAPLGVLASVSPELMDSIHKMDETFTNLSAKFDASYQKIDGILDQTSQLMGTANKMASNANGFMSDPSLKKTLRETLGNVQESTANARLMTAQLRRDLDDLVGSSKGNFKEMGVKLNTLLDHVDATIQDTDAVVTKLTEQVTDPHLQQSLQETAELARATLSRFNQIASDIHELTGDPALQGNLKQTVANLRSATDRGQQAVEKVDQLLNKVTSVVDSSGKPRLPKIELYANASEQISPTRFRLDLDAKVPIGRHGLIDAGFYDVGQDTRLNLQAGTKLTDALTVRYGLYASRLGAGLDYMPQEGTGIRADLWDSTRLRLDLRGLFRVNKNASMWIGADNLLRTPYPLIGVQFHP